jgi:hypothetical protein
MVRSIAARDSGLSLLGLIPLICGFLFIISIASRIVSFENVSRILGSAPFKSLIKLGRMYWLSNCLNLKLHNEICEDICTVGLEGLPVISHKLLTCLSSCNVPLVPQDFPRPTLCDPSTTNKKIQASFSLHSSKAHTCLLNIL